MGEKGRIVTAPPITADQALDAAAGMIVQVVHGLVKTTEGREEVMLELIAQLSQSREGREAEMEIVRLVVERLRG